MKRQRVKSLPSQNKPQGNGLPSSWQSHNIEKARGYAFLLLKFRLRSEAELFSRLKQKGFSEELSQSTISFLKAKKFIDDRIFAKGWVVSRLKRPFGLRRIKQELLAKGLDKEIIDGTLSEAKNGYDEIQVAGQLARQRFSRQKGIEPQKAKSRVYAYLLRRGFSPDIVSGIIKQL